MKMNGASSLLSKYTSLTNSIATCRAESKSHEEQISSLQSTTASLEIAHQSMQQELQRTIQHSKELSKSISSGSQAESEHQELTRNEMELRQKVDLHRIKLHENDETRKAAQRDFRKSCREFRMAVRTSRVALKGFAEDDRVKGNMMFSGTNDSHNSDISSYTYSCSYNEDGEQSQLKIRDKNDDNVEDNDDEMKEALLQKEKSMQIYNGAKECLGAARSEKYKLEKEAHDRIKNLHQQRDQLDRVRKDVHEMERELEELDQGTKECERISAGYAKDATRRRQNQRRGNGANTTPRTSSAGTRTFGHNNSVTPSPNNSSNQKSANRSGGPQSSHSRTVRNVYSNGNNINTTNNNSNTTTTTNNSNFRQIRNPYNTQVGNPYKRKNPNGNTSVTRRGSNEPCTSSSSFETQQLRTQHPHRAGRIRVDRQFSTALSIGDCNENDTTMVQGHLYSNGNDNGEENGRISVDADKSNRADDDFNTMCTSSMGTSDEDDDDDDVLLFIPFTNPEEESS